MQLDAPQLSERPDEWLRRGSYVPGARQVPLDSYRVSTYESYHVQDSARGDFELSVFDEPELSQRERPPSERRRCSVTKDSSTMQSEDIGRPSWRDWRSTACAGNGLCSASSEREALPRPNALPPGDAPAAEALSQLSLQAVSSSASPTLACDAVNHTSLASQSEPLKLLPHAQARGRGEVVASHNKRFEGPQCTQNNGGSTGSQVLHRRVPQEVDSPVVRL